MSKENDKNTAFEYISNAEVKQKWGLSEDADPKTIPLEKINPGNNDWFARNQELELFKRLRNEDPIHFTEDSQFGPYWSITSYEDIKSIDMDNGSFSSDIMNGGIRLGGLPMQEPPDELFHLPMFIMQDQPKHTDQRKEVAPMFTEENLKTFEELIRSRTCMILDNLPDGKTFNWVKEVSVELTGQMLATIFDVPQEDRSKLIYWSDTVENLSNPDFFETADEGFAELWKCFEYFDAVWKERAARSEPGSDLISSLVHGEATKNMTPNEFLGNMLLLIVGGNDNNGTNSSYDYIK